jgi:hypothetical protein
VEQPPQGLPGRGQNRASVAPTAARCTGSRPAKSWPTATWNGGNSSTARINLIRVNGFDENFGYGAEDIELGFRLNNAGIHGCHLRYTAPVLHLEHERAYAQPGDRSRNKRAARQILRQGKTMASQGIGEL